MGADDSGRAADSNPLDDLPDMSEGTTRIAQLYVSLFLILIAFFMVLNSVSNQQVAKAEAVMESVQSTFKKQFAPPVEVIDLLASKGVASHSDDYYRAVEGIFAAMIDFPGTFASPGGVLLQAELPASVLFPLGQVHVRADQTRFLNALADLLIASGPGERREVEIVMAAPASVLTDEKPWANSHVLRMAAFARDLEDRGVSSAAISAGVVIDDRDLVWLNFTTRRLDAASPDGAGS